MLNMGGPATLDKVEPFLSNLFSDPDIIPLGRFQPQLGPWIGKRRAPSIAEQYKEIGGGSPIGRWTDQQGAAMCERLDQLRPEVSGGVSRCPPPSFLMLVGVRVRLINTTLHSDMQIP